ncbi:MAG: DUF3828 domain-containing protein [Ancalomicrobiaceae bacterium]|nr:DUF3828 domain-containing protein [Ancalomicrobiaceae bacterium]
MMLARRQLLAFLAAGAVAAVAAPACAEVPAKKVPPPPAAVDAKPEVIVRNLYERYAAEAYDYLDDKLRSRYFTKAMSQLIGKVFAKSKQDDVPGIDYEPLIDGQDGEVKGLAIVVTSESPAKATVEARFTSVDDKITVTFDFVSEAGGWKIDDIRGKDSSLKEISKQFLQE